MKKMWWDDERRGGGGGGGGGYSPPPVGIDYDAIQKILQDRFTANPKSSPKLVALLFGRPQVELINLKIIPNSSYWHYRSGDSIDFFCIGFSSSQRVQWDAEKFTKTLDRFESETNWKYSGGTDLLLLNSFLKNGRAVLDPSSAMVITLEVALANAVIVDVPIFFETLIRDAKKFSSTSQVSNAKGKNLIEDALKSLLISLLPEPLRKPAENAFSFVVRDISKS